MLTMTAYIGPEALRGLFWTARDYFGDADIIQLLTIEALDMM